MLHARLYVRAGDRKKLYGIETPVAVVKEKFHDFLITNHGSDEFAALVGSCQRPIYGIAAEQTGTLSLCDDLDTAFAALHGCGNMLIIPLLGGIDVAVAPRFAEPTGLLRTVKAHSALLYHGSTKGTVIPALVKDPLAFLDRKVVIVNGAALARRVDIARAIWKMRGNHPVVSLGMYLEHTGDR